jgi:dihydroorotate dehydrogenase electron transfer subunit
MKQLKARILSNKSIFKKYYLIRMVSSYIAGLVRPGQFVHIRCSGRLTPLLRRPFSIHRVDGETIGILYQVVGKGTEVLSEKRPGEYLDIIGPLGKGFEIENKDSILIAGGIGVAPLLILGQWLIRVQKNNQITVLIGAKNKKLILCKEDFEKLQLKVKLATEDGSCGYRGMVTDLLKKTLATNRRQLAIYACGPEKMLKKTEEISVRHNLKAQGSLERNMACGVGACLGCVIKTRDGYKRVCQDGPVFELSQIVWDI